MTKNLLLFFFSIFISHSSFSQFIEFKGMEIADSIQFFQMEMYKCSGCVFTSPCKTFFVQDDVFDWKKSKHYFHECFCGDVYYPISPFDTVIIHAELLKKFYNYIRQYHPEIFNQIKEFFDPYMVDGDFVTGTNRLQRTLLTSKKNYKIYRYTGTNVKYLVFRIRPSVFNDMFKGNVLVKLFHIDEYINVNVILP